MERSLRPYSSQKRPTRKKNHFIYYIKFRDPETGTYLNATSSGCTSKAAACNWAEEQLKSGRVKSFAKGFITFDNFATDFWDYDKSAYIQGKLARGDSISKGYASICAGYVRKYLVPHFGQRTLDSLKPVDFERLILKLSKNLGLSPSSVNRIYTAMRVMLREALRLGYISKDPTAQVRLIREQSPEKGILTLDEAKKLFAETALADHWGNDLSSMTANALAAATGLRLGEIRGLTLGCVYEDHIDVLHSWEEGFGLKEPKRDSSRIIPITPPIHKSLLSIAKLKKASQPDHFIFSGKSPELPVSKWALPNRLKTALTSIGIKEESQKSRCLTFHSWRHFFNSMLRGKLPDEKLRLMTGHKTEEMTERYSHVLPEDLTAVRDYQSLLIIR